MNKEIEIPEGYEARIEGNKVILELKKSKDERIRDRIISYLKLDIEEYPEREERINEMLAYLEKHKEPIPIPDKYSGLKSLMLQYLQSAANRKDDAEIESDTDLWVRKILDYVRKCDERQKEQKPTELPKSEDYGIDGLYAAVDILQKTLGKVDGYQTDDGILEHKCAISAVKELYKQKPAEWSEEDEEIKHDIELCIEFFLNEGSAIAPGCNTIKEDALKWIKFLKDRIQPKQEWMAGQEATSIKGYLNRNIDDQLVLSLSPNHADDEWLLFKSDLFPNIKSGDAPRCVNIIIKEQV